MAKHWYVVHAYSGFESHVKRSLEERVERAGMQDLFGEILVPTEQVVENAATLKNDLGFISFAVENQEIATKFWRTLCPQLGRNTALRSLG